MQEAAPAPRLQLLAAWEKQCEALAERLPDPFVATHERTTVGLDAAEAAVRASYLRELAAEKLPDRPMPEGYAEALLQPQEAEHSRSLSYVIPRENGDLRELTLDEQGAYQGHWDWYADARAQIVFLRNQDGDLEAGVWPLEEGQGLGNLPVIPTEFIPQEFGRAIRAIAGDAQGRLIADREDCLEVSWEWQPGGHHNPVSTPMPPGFDAVGGSITLVLRRVHLRMGGDPVYVAEASYYDLRGKPLRHVRASVEVSPSGNMSFTRDRWDFPIGSRGAPNLVRSAVRPVDGGVLPVERLDAALPDLTGIPVQDWRVPEMGAVEYRYEGRLPALEDLLPDSPAVDEF